NATPPSPPPTADIAPAARSDNAAPLGDAAAHTSATAPNRSATCKALAAKHDLTEREFDVLVKLSRGQSVADISSELGVSENTAKTHIKNVYRKLGVHSKQDIIEMCREMETRKS
ncbi:response regulator transcription factor, partial [Raoultibacter timonensis]|uniref:response regulator transcription factor n=1 Tax=Raoultibacter timonensis TaxID=1907662 RepID=UPI0015E16AA3